MTEPLKEDIDWLEHHGVKGQRWGVVRKANKNATATWKAGHAANKKARSEKRAFKKEKKEFIKSITPKRTTAQKVQIGLDIAAIALIGATFVAKSQKNKSLSAAKASSFTSNGNDWIKNFQSTPAALKPFVVNSAGVVSR